MEPIDLPSLEREEIFLLDGRTLRVRGYVQERVSEGARFLRRTELRLRKDRGR